MEQCLKTSTVPLAQNASRGTVLKNKHRSTRSIFELPEVTLSFFENVPGAKRFPNGSALKNERDALKKYRDVL